MLSNTDFKRMGDIGLQKIMSLQYFYKYVNLYDGVNHILKENTFKFSDPLDFNDPFDCNEQLIHVTIDKKKEREIIEEASLKFNVSRKDKRKLLIKAGNPKTYTDALKEKKKDYKVSCFSEIPDEILMWSHYADKHRGLCIKFELDFMCDDYVFYPVNYISEVQTVDGMANTPFVFYYFVTVKANRWAYEKEIRAVSKTGNSIIHYHKQAVKEIIFGCNVKTATIESTIRDIKRMNYKGLIFSKMELNPKTMGLKKILIKL